MEAEIMEQKWLPLSTIAAILGIRKSRIYHWKIRKIRFYDKLFGNLEEARNYMEIAEQYNRRK